MYVNNLEKENKFFETYFDAKAGDKYDDNGMVGTWTYWELTRECGKM